VNERKGHMVKSAYKLVNSAHDHKNIWLLKPTGFNRGVGIHIFRTIEEFKKIMKETYDIN
jgi:hypothetical protein